MSWLFGKKEDKAPKLPEPPELPRIEIPELPELKTDEASKNELPALPSLPQIEEARSNELNANSKLITQPRTRELGEFEEFTPKPVFSARIKNARKEEPIFVRIDRYQESFAALQEVKKKALEIENLLKNIKEIRAREEAELQGWEKEIQEAKTKLDKIDRTVFQKLEE